MYLVDTNVISASAPNRLGTSSELTAWLARNSPKIYLSAVTIGEIESGIAKVRRTGSSRRADRFAEWLDLLLHLYGNRIMPLDTRVARVLGRLTDLAQSIGRHPDYADLIIAATAETHDYTVLTRNLRHFQDMPVRCHDPFDSLPKPG